MRNIIDKIEDKDVIDFLEYLKYERRMSVNTIDSYGENLLLISDILKKNGWDAYSSVFPNNHKENFFIKDVGGTHLIAGRGNLSIWLDCEKDNDEIYADIVFPIKYVHQLQQVLRLAGMTDMANNFKI